MLYNIIYKGKFVKRLLINAGNEPERMEYASYRGRYIEYVIYYTRGGTGFDISNKKI